MENKLFLQNFINVNLEVWDHNVNHTIATLHFGEYQSNFYQFYVLEGSQDFFSVLEVNLDFYWTE